MARHADYDAEAAARVGAGLDMPRRALAMALGVYFRMRDLLDRLAEP